MAVSVRDFLSQRILNKYEPVVGNVCSKTRAVLLLGYKTIAMNTG